MFRFGEVEAFGPRGRPIHLDIWIPRENNSNISGPPRTPMFEFVKKHSSVKTPCHGDGGGKREGGEGGNVLKNVIIFPHTLTTSVFFNGKTFGRNEGYHLFYKERTHCKCAVTKGNTKSILERYLKRKLGSQRRESKDQTREHVETAAEREHWSIKYVLLESNDSKCSRNQCHHPAPQFAESSRLAPTTCSSTKETILSRSHKIPIGNGKTGTIGKVVIIQAHDQQDGIFLQVVRTADPFTHANRPGTRGGFGRPKAWWWTSTSRSEREETPHRTDVLFRAITHSGTNSFFVSATQILVQDISDRKVIGHNYSTVPLDILWCAFHIVQEQTHTFISVISDSHQILRQSEKMFTTVAQQIANHAEHQHWSAQTHHSDVSEKSTIVTRLRASECSATQ